MARRLKRTPQTPHAALCERAGRLDAVVLECTNLPHTAKN
jgi:hypothetical protein